jgi:hypothetical protein
VGEGWDAWKLLRRSGDVPECSNPWDIWHHRALLKKPPSTPVQPHHGDDGAWGDHNDPPPPHGMKRPSLFQYMLPPLSAEAWIKTEQK